MITFLDQGRWVVLLKAGLELTLQKDMQARHNNAFILSAERIS